MNTSVTDYYVYVYIDPRNYEEFYFGKGKGSRKLAHLKDNSDSDKTQRIRAIRKEGLEPIIKVIVKDLTEREAFLIEKTLIWKLGKTLTNKSSGHFAAKFRPHDTLHLDLPYFDYQYGLYYVNVGEGDHRSWDDCRAYGFLAAGQGKKWSDPIRTLEKGDVVVAYLKSYGYVGIGRVGAKAVRVNDFKYKNKTLNLFDLRVANIYDNCNNESSEYLVKVNWIKSFDRNNAKWKPKSGLFTTQLVKASLQGQPKTIAFLEQEFGLIFSELMSQV